MSRVIFGRRPFVSLTISLALGISLGAHFSFSTWRLLPAAGILWAAALALHFSRLRLRQDATAVLCLLAVTAGGMLLAGTGKNVLSQAGSLLPFLDKGPVMLQARMLSMPERMQDRIMLTVQAERVFQDDEAVPTSGKVRIKAHDVPEGLFRGDRVRMKVSLRRPVNFNNPGCFDYVEYLARRGIAVRGGQERNTPILRIGAGRGLSFHSLVEKAQLRIRRIIIERGGEGGGLVRALIIGERRAVSREVVDAFQETGLAHLLSISGLHLGMVALFGFVLFRRIFGFSSRIALHLNLFKVSAVFTMALVLLYALIAGTRIPTIRALVMAWVFLLAVISGRRYEIWNIFFLAAFIVLLVWPTALFEASFALSFTAVASLIYLMPRLWILVPRTTLFLKPSRLDFLEEKSGFSMRRIFRRVYQYLLNIFLASFIAQLGVSPLVVHYFHQFSPMAPVFNLAVLPLCGLVIIPAGILGAVTAPFAPGVSGTVFSLAGHVSSIVSQLVQWFGTFRWSSILVRPISLPEVIAFYGLGVSLLELSILKLKGRPSWVLEREALARGNIPDETPERAVPYLRVRLLKWFFVSALVVSILGSEGLSAGRYLAQRFERRLHFSVIDVSFGQSILIEFPDNKSMLIDGGGFYGDAYDVGRFVVAPFLLSRGRKTLDVVVLTHPHPDHGNGLRYILEHFRVGEFWTIADKNDLSEDLTGIANERDVPVRIMDRSSPGLDFAGARLAILNPSPGRAGSEVDLNDRSMVIKLDYGKTGFLIPSDVNKKTEAELIELYEPSGTLPSDILVAPHHGSRSSSSSAFLEAVAPTHAVFSARYQSWIRLPSSSVLKRYEKLGIKTWRTDENGAVTISTDGRDYRIEGFLDSRSASSSPHQFDSASP